MTLTSVYSPRTATRALSRAISELLAGQVGFGSTVGEDTATVVEVWVVVVVTAVLVVATPAVAVLVFSVSTTVELGMAEVCDASDDLNVVSLVIATGEDEAMYTLVIILTGVGVKLTTVPAK